MQRQAQAFGAQAFGAQAFDDAHRFGGSDFSLMVATTEIHLAVFPSSINLKVRYSFFMFGMELVVLSGLPLRAALLTCTL